ncbi:MAG: tetrahydromethanopterin S-methyltransferase subunit C [Methanogenium sp.]|nr:tetrahydromethanopterin S-methyltransferase subunit C [Methanogenium sp.]
MSAEISVTEHAGDKSHDTILGIGLVGSLVCIYLTYINIVTGTQIFAFLGGIGAVLALWWGTNSIKTLCSYGIGTGVPSAGMLALGSGVIAMLFATKLGAISPLLIPVACVVIAAILGAVLGFISNSVLNMNIPVMPRMITELTIVGSLTMLGFTAMLGGSFMFEDLVLGTTSVFGIEVTNFAASTYGGGILATVFILGGLALQHSFNACLGPNESQDRTLMLAAECGFLSMIGVSIMSVAFLSIGSVIVSLLVSVIGWAYTYNEYIVLSKRDAYEWLDAKPIKEKGGA